MKGGARRKTVSSERLQSPPPHSLQNEIDLHGNDEVEYNRQKRGEEKQQPIHHGADGGNEFDEEEDDDYEVSDDQFGDLEVDGGGADGDAGKGDEERPKLAEGFYEIEAVRKKRIRKGETQYLIKWRGWPETANTWEPVENLMSCSDVIDAFEASLRSGKQRSNRKRKRKNAVAPTPQSKKKQKQQPQPQQHSPAATYAVPAVKVKIIEKSSSLPSVHNSNFSNGAENHAGGTSNNESTRRQERNELDEKLNEHKGASFIDQENVNEFAIHIQEDRATEGVRPANGVLKVDGTDPIRASARIGAKRRKSGAVKRFKQDSNPSFTNDVAEKITSATENPPLVSGFGSNNMVDDSRSMCAITKIIKPVDYSTSILNGAEEVSVSFSVMREDGQKTTVDNKFLKATNPLLLINFYEQHLRYNSPSE